MEGGWGYPPLFPIKAEFPHPVRNSRFDGLAEKTLRCGRKDSGSIPGRGSFSKMWELNDDEDNALLADHLDEVEQGFDFLVLPQLDRHVRRLGVTHRNYVGRLMQRGGAVPLRGQRQILPQQIEQALQRAIREQVLNDPEVRPNDHFLININSNRLIHSYHSARIRVREWMDNDLRAQQIMQQISHMLNCNEQF